jgi:Cu/Ag efflux pump CusA
LGARGAVLTGLVGVPAVLGAGVVALWVDDAPLGPGGLAGLVVLGGLLLRSALVVVPDLQRSANPDELRRVATAHAVPLMQACGVLAVLTVPWLTVGQRAGTEQLHPFAVVLLGGMPALAAVSVLVLPGLIGNASRGPSDDDRDSPGGEALAPISVSRWIDEIESGRSHSASREPITRIRGE